MTARAAIAAALLSTAATAALGGPREIPDSTLTPGVVASTDAAEVCGIEGGLSYSKRHRQTPAGLKALVRKRYGIAGGGEWEIDHRVPLALGGADVAYNLWPQPGNGHGAAWTFHDKDRLEQFAWERVCKMQRMFLAEAQRMFLAPDWRVAYCATFADDKRCPP